MASISCGEFIILYFKPPKLIRNLEGLRITAYKILLGLASQKPQKRRLFQVLYNYSCRQSSCFSNATMTIPDQIRSLVFLLQCVYFFIFLSQNDGHFEKLNGTTLGGIFMTFSMQFSDSARNLALEKLRSGRFYEKKYRLAQPY